MKKILGLDLGTNSIGWAVLNAADDNSLKYIEAAGSRIIPMDAAILGDFERVRSLTNSEFYVILLDEANIVLVNDAFHEFLFALPFEKLNYLYQNHLI